MQGAGGLLEVQKLVPLGVGPRTGTSAKARYGSQGTGWPLWEQHVTGQKDPEGRAVTWETVASCSACAPVTPRAEAGGWGQGPYLPTLVSGSPGELAMHGVCVDSAARSRGDRGAHHLHLGVDDR